MMEDRLEPVKDVANCYIDDIIIGSPLVDGEDVFLAHDRDLRRVLEVLKKWSLIADMGKCRLFMPEVEFCGHILGSGRRRPAPGKLMAIEKWDPPVTVSSLRSFLWFVNYYAVNVHKFAESAATLQEKLKLPKELGKKGRRSE